MVGKCENCPEGGEKGVNTPSLWEKGQFYSN